MPRQIKLFIVVTLIAILLLAMPHITRSADTLPKVDLVMWHLQGSADGVQALFTDWANTNAPGSTLKLIPKQVDDLQTDFLAPGSSDKPDLLWTVADHTASFVAAGLLQPVDGLVDTSLMLPAVTQITAIQGKTYGVPVQAGNQLMLFYNKKFVPQAPKTFDDLAKIGQQLQTANPDPTKFMALVYDQREVLWVFPFANAFGATLFAADGKTPVLDTPAWTQTYELIYDLQFKDKIEPTDCNSYQCTDQRFKDGTAAMIFNGDWALDGDNGYIKILGDQLGIAPYPAIDSSLKISRPRSSSGNMS